MEVKPGVSALTKTPAQLFDPAGVSAATGLAATINAKHIDGTITAALRPM